MIAIAVFGGLGLGIGVCHAAALIGSRLLMAG
jgi:hypothetical protein